MNKKPIQLIFKSGYLYKSNRKATLTDWWIDNGLIWGMNDDDERMGIPLTNLVGLVIDRK